MSININILYVFVIAVSAVLSVYLMFFPSSMELFFNENAWEAALTFTMLTVLAGGSGFLVQSIVKERDRKEEIRRADTDKVVRIRDEFTELYNKVKRCRRVIRSNSVFKFDGAYANGAILDAEMNFLQDAHLGIEKIRRLSVGDEALCGLQDAELLSKLISKIDKNLRTILNEYELSYDKRRDIEAHNLVPLGFWVRQFILPTGDDKLIHNLLFRPCNKVFRILWSKER